MAHAIRQNPAYKLSAFDKRPLAKQRRGLFIMRILLPGNPMLHTRTTLFAASVVIGGCRSTTVPSPVLQPVATAGSTDISTNSINSWVLAPSRQPHTYHSTSQTTVHEPSNSTIRQNTIETTTTFTILLDQLHTPLIISGHIDTINVHPHNQPSLENKEFRLPLIFEGELASTALTISIKNSQLTDGACSPFISSVLGDLRAVVIAYPSRLTSGFTWKDSTLVTTCTMGGILTTTKTIQLFRVVGERAFNTTRAILLQRLDSTYVSGDGSQGNHQIHLEGVGTGTANIYINPSVAVTLGVELFEKLEITISNSGRIRHFIQEVTQKLEATN